MLVVLSFSSPPHATVFGICWPVASVKEGCVRLVAAYKNLQPLPMSICYASSHGLILLLVKKEFSLVYLVVSFWSFLLEECWCGWRDFLCKQEFLLVLHICRGLLFGSRGSLLHRLWFYGILDFDRHLWVNPTLVVCCPFFLIQITIIWKTCIIIYNF